MPDMWQRLARPEAVIYLDASFATCTRRKRLDWLPHEHQEQLRRLAHARANCDVYISTDDLSMEAVLQAAVEALKRGS